MDQSEFPFHETAEDATSKSISDSKMTYEQVANTLWPHMKLNSAYARLKNALREDAREVLTADQHLFIANLTGQYHFLYYCAQHCHHSQPDPVAPADEKAALQHDFNESVTRLEELAQRIQHVEAREQPVRNIRDTGR